MILGLFQKDGKNDKSIFSKTVFLKISPTQTSEKSDPCADKDIVCPRWKAKELKGELRRSTNPSICDDMHKHHAQSLT